MPPRDIKDANWPKSGASGVIGGANDCNGDGINGRARSDGACGNADEISKTEIKVGSTNGNASPDTANSSWGKSDGATTGGDFDNIPNRQVSQQGHVGNGQRCVYGQVRLYWWQESGVDWGIYENRF